MAVVIGTNEIDVIQATLQDAEMGNIFRGDGGNDRMSGSSGNDNLFGDTGDDTLKGGDGDDALSGGAGNDVLDGGDGHDVLVGGVGDDRLNGDSGNDALQGGSGNDVLEGGNGNDVVEAGSGKDHIYEGHGDDNSIGGADFDTLDFSGALQGMTIDMSKGTASGMGNDTFSGIEAVVGSRFDDTIKGSNGDDVIYGGNGNDVIRSLGGNDTVSGGFGSDTYKFNLKDAQAGGFDTILDFGSSDKLDLTDIFKGTVNEENIDEFVHLELTAAGVMVSVKMGEAYVDVALLANQHVELTGSSLLGENLFV